MYVLCFLTLHWPRGTVRTNTYGTYRCSIQITQLYIFVHSTVESGARPLQVKMKKKKVHFNHV